MPSKTILGLDVGITSIGFAKVIESENPSNSSIELIGVRVNPITTDEERNFKEGKPVSGNAERTLKRGMRRNLDRYQLRRANLIDILKTHHIIDDTTVLAEDGKNTTHSTYAFRAAAATTQIPLDALARVLLAINKKRGYKSSRKAKNDADGQFIDDMAIAKRLYDEGLTPGQLVYQLLLSGTKRIPKFYRSDLRAELNRIWDFQQQFYPDILSETFKNVLDNAAPKKVTSEFLKRYAIDTAETKGSKDEKRLQEYSWRSRALNEPLHIDQVALVISIICNEIKNSSDYLGAISDRSKELFFGNLTVGQYLYNQLLANPHSRLKGQVFYRQDYLNEFEQIWETQARYYPQLTRELKEEIRDVIIFYQRKLKSQKGLISFCEFESKEIEVMENGKTIRKRIGARAIPKSSPLFQQFKIWQVLNNLELTNKRSREIFVLDINAKQQLFDELNLKGSLSISEALKILGQKPRDWESNYSILEGNNTNKALFNAFLQIIEIEGLDELLGKIKEDDLSDISKINKPATDIIHAIHTAFEKLGIDTGILYFDAELEEQALIRQPSYELWHALYSIEDDSAKPASQSDIINYGNDNVTLKKKLVKKFGFSAQHANVLSKVAVDQDYGNLSSKAIRKIYPFIKEHTYDKACLAAGYRHSSDSLTREENEERVLKPKLTVLKKNELRSPVVEKILNQMVNLVNTLIEDENRKRREKGLPEDFHFDEIRIELARDLKKNAKQRAELTSRNNKSKLENELIRKKITQDFPHITHPSRNDVVRYKLYQELVSNGYKDLYTDTKIEYSRLFDKDYDVDHIIPQAKLFDDSFSNKVLVPYEANRDKGRKNNATAYDYMATQSPEAFDKYLAVVNKLYEEKKISKAKFLNLQKKGSEISYGFIERDLRETQYIARKAKSMLLDITRSVVSTTGEITSRLREDWGLMNILQELNLPKFRKSNLTEFINKKDGGQKEVILDWTKRNDHRHHAMDALVVAFTKRSYIQYLNSLNARANAVSPESDNPYELVPVQVLAIEKKELARDAAGKLRFNLPIPNFRQQAKRHLENVLVSHKTKNKVVTRNKNWVHGKDIPQETLTPRGQLHKESIYGRYHYYSKKEHRVDGSFDLETIRLVTDPVYRTLLLQRILENQNDPKIAFTGKNSLSNTPIYLDETRTETVPLKVELAYLSENYSIRKDITPENFKDINALEKVVDKAVRNILIRRLESYGNDSKKAFSNLEENPIWINKEKGISIKRTKVEGIRSGLPLHYKKDHRGEYLLDKEGKKIPVDFVNTGNNHHVAIYQDIHGNWQERIVSFFDAVQLASEGLPVIDKQYNQSIGWEFRFTMKQNEMFVFPNINTGFDPLDIDLLNPENRCLISPNLFRVQQLSSRDYTFRHHLETSSEKKTELKDISFKRVRNPNDLKDIVKVRINHIGQIVAIGEY